MRGTEKQIQWATKIQANVIRTLEEAIDMMGKVNAPEDIRRKNIEDTTEWLEAVKNAEYAGDIIDLFKDIPQTGDLNNRFGSLMSARRIKVPGSEAQRKLLHK